MRNGKSSRGIGRRCFLAAGAAVASGAALRDAGAFGEVPSSGQASMPAAGAEVGSILEVFLAGGFSQHESLLAMPGFGDSAQGPEGWHSHLRSGELERVLGDCSYSGDLLTEFAPDRDGNLVHLGPFVDPI